MQNSGHAATQYPHFMQRDSSTDARPPAMFTALSISAGEPPNIIFFIYF